MPVCRRESLKKGVRQPPSNMGELGYTRYTILAVFILYCATVVFCDNITCYQCVRKTIEECGSEDLKPCPEGKDRCVTHIQKSEQTGLILKRECGLGACQFEDSMMNRGLGLDGCDRSKDDYFCIFCCRENGCNKSAAVAILHISSALISNVFLFVSIKLLLHMKFFQ